MEFGRWGEERIKFEKLSQITQYLGQIDGKLGAGAGELAAVLYI